MTTPLKIAYFGTPDFSTFVLDELAAAGMTPALVVTRPDAPAGRGLALRQSPVKAWALVRGIPVATPDDLKQAAGQFAGYDLFIVAAYGKLLPKNLLALPRLGTLNVHPSLLPEYRGPSPLEAQILADEKEVGVSVIVLDEETDHGPVLAQKSISLPEPVGRKALEKMLWTEGGALLAEAIPHYAEGSLLPHEQDHAKATFTPKLSKEDGLLDLAGDARKNYLKYLAYEGWPGTYFFSERSGAKTRVKITAAEFTDGAFRVLRVIPENRREMSYDDFLRISLSGT
jgi:methionyl-tRNA formyltransferase